MAKMMRPPTRARRRPYRSPRAPAGNSRAARVSVYPSMSQVSWFDVASMSGAISGIAVFNAAIAATTIETAVHTTKMSQTVRNPNFSPGPESFGDAPTDVFIHSK